MKLFVIFIFCFLTPLIVDAGQTQDDNYNCICVDSAFCNDQFTPFIRPRSLRQECNAGNQICCRPEHITKFPNYNLPTPSDYNPNTPQCGRSNPISSGYGRLVTPNYVAKLGEIPWQVAILRNSSVGTFFISNGVLLNQYALLTSARNLNNLYPDQIIARLGENNFQADPSRKYPALNAKISRITIDPEYNPNTIIADLAVLCLKSPVKLSQTINPVCIPDPGDFISDTARCVVSGWGKNSLYGNYSTVLRKSYVNLVPVDICENQLKAKINDPTYKLEKTTLCAIGQDNKDATCIGDIGSPLTCTNKNNQQVLLGYVKSGVGCGEKNVPAIYTNIRDTNTLEFLKNAVQACIPQSPPVNNDYQSSYNNDYTVVNYNSNNYNYDSNQNYNNPSNYNQMNVDYNSNPSSDYNSNSIGYTGRSADPTSGITGFQIDN